MYKFCAVKFNRGTGLGNKLFPWARCIVYAKKNNLKVIIPNWFQLRRGAFIAGGINYKTSLGKILLLNNFKKNPEYIQNFQKLKTKLFQQKHIKYFSGDADFFEGLREDREFILCELLKIVNKKSLAQLNQYQNYPIVLNIRRGKDFKDAQTEEDFINKGGLRTPLKWFKETLLLIRKYSGQNYPTLIVSDGTEDDLRDILKLENTTLAITDMAITDLILLTKAKIILGSGGSSFSAWGSFLSQAITLSIPGQSLQWFKISDDMNRHFVGIFDYKNPDYNILKKIYENLQTN